MQFEKTNKTKVILLYCCGIKVDVVFFKVSLQLKILITKVIDLNQTCTVVLYEVVFSFSFQLILWIALIAHQRSTDVHCIDACSL